MAAIPYYAFGGDAQDNVALSISSGPLKVTVEIMLLLHLVAAFPILLNPPAQYFENLMEIPLGKLELVSKELNHFGVIADLFRQIGGHSSRFVLFCSF